MRNAVWRVAGAERDASLLMSVGIGDAFDRRAWLFVTGYLLLQVGRAAFLIVALHGKALGEHSSTT